VPGFADDWARQCSVALFAFSDSGEGQKIWLAKGDEVKKLELPEATTALSWSPDLKLVAYSLLNDPGRVKVKSGSPSGSTVLDRKLGARGGFWWSPQGDQVAFLDDGSAIADPGSREKAGSPWAGGLSVLDIKKGRGRRIIHNPESPGDPLLRAEWSPDGRWVAAMDEGGGLSVVRPDGTSQRYCEKLVTGFSWLPDGRGLLVTGASFLGWRGAAVWTIEDGKFDLVVAPNEEMSSEEFDEPCLSPDGTKVAFSYEARSKETGDRGTVCVLCLDLQSGKVNVVATGEGAAWSPRFLPDGSVAFLSNGDPVFAYVIADKAEMAGSDGTSRKTLASVPGELFYSLAIAP